MLATVRALVCPEMSALEQRRHNGVPPASPHAPDIRFSRSLSPYVDIRACSDPCSLQPSVEAAEPGSIAAWTKRVRLTADASGTRAIRTPLDRPCGYSPAVATSAFFPVWRPETPSSMPPTNVSSTSTWSERRSRPGRTIARRSSWSRVRAVLQLPILNSRVRLSALAPALLLAARL